MWEQSEFRGMKRFVTEENYLAMRRTWFAAGALTMLIICLIVGLLV